MGTPARASFYVKDLNSKTLDLLLKRIRREGGSTVRQALDNQ